MLQEAIERVAGLDLPIEEALESSAEQLEEPDEILQLPEIEPMTLSAAVQVTAPVKNSEASLSEQTELPEQGDSASRFRHLFTKLRNIRSRSA